jgi:hypothetical protein
LGESEGIQLGFPSVNGSPLVKGIDLLVVVVVVIVVLNGIAQSISGLFGAIVKGAGVHQFGYSIHIKRKEKTNQGIVCESK